MLRHFVQFYNQNLKKLNIDAYLLMYSGDITAYGKTCPDCKAPGRFTSHASYERWLCIYTDRVTEERMSINRLKCGCGRTHAVLPDIAVPYRSYSLIFIMTVLKEYFTRSSLGITVEGIADKYGIAVTTIYEWKIAFIAHRSLWLGALAALTSRVAEFFDAGQDPVKASGDIEVFFQRFGFSFMQRHDTS